MKDPKYLFQYCQKLILFSRGWQSVFLARRAGEADYDKTFAFIGGKMEITDHSFLAGLSREVREEIGNKANIKVYPGATWNTLFDKKDGNKMILPHFVGQFLGGEIQLNLEEHSEYRWVKLNELKGLEPKVENIPECVDWALRIKDLVNDGEWIEI